MSYDDEDAKSRRNLVVASTLVLAGVWLRIPPGALIERLTGVKPDQPDQLATSRMRKYSPPKRAIFFGE
ncbi:hypothetical protein, partial [uncultured Variovorax sp.]